MQVVSSVCRQHQRGLQLRCQSNAAAEASTSKDQQSLYDNPALYDAVFSSRDLPEEVCSPALPASVMLNASADFLCLESLDMTWGEFLKRGPAFG